MSISVQTYPNQSNLVKSFQICPARAAFSGQFLLSCLYHNDLTQYLLYFSSQVGGTDTKHYLHLCDAIYRFQPVRLTKSGISMFHGTDEKISVNNFNQVYISCESLLYFPKLSTKTCQSAVCLVRF